MNRRNVVLAAAALASVAIGAGTALRRSPGDDLDDTPVGPVDIWSLAFEGVDAGPGAHLTRWTTAGWPGCLVWLGVWWVVRRSSGRRAMLAVAHRGGQRQPPKRTPAVHKIAPSPSSRRLVA